MRISLRNRPVLRYVFAIAATALAIGVVRGTDQVVGYVPLLFLPAVAAIEAYAGPGPALLSIALSILGSSLFITMNPILNEIGRAHV